MPVSLSLPSDVRQHIEAFETRLGLGPEANELEIISAAVIRAKDNDPEANYYLGAIYYYELH